MRRNKIFWLLKLRAWGKLILLTTILSVSIDEVIAQLCDENISTNPVNPQNTEIDAIFPTLTNPWLNTFDFGAYQNQTFDPIYINSTAGWQIPDWTNPAPYSKEYASVVFNKN